MIHTIREAFNELLAENHWMDEETGAVAKEKADAMNERIGYPQMITDPEALVKEYKGVGAFIENKKFWKLVNVYIGGVINYVWNKMIVRQQAWYSVVLSVLLLNIEQATWKYLMMVLWSAKIQHYSK